jgi:hypothetical protein
MTASTASIPVLHSAEVVPYTDKSCYPSAKGSCVTPGFKEQSRVHLIHAPKKTTYIITECIEINVTI